MKWYVLLAAFACGCLHASPKDGAWACATDQSCPDGYSCLSGTCWKIGDSPDGFSSTSGSCVTRMTSTGVSYCIDATEVTQAAYYTVWKGLANGTSAKVPEGGVCGSSIDLTPSMNDLMGWPPPLSNNLLPMVGVDWCQAYAYCKEVNERLCGSVTGGSLSSSDIAKPDVGQWYTACAGPSGQAYPYGSTWSLNAGCNVGGAHEPHQVTADSNCIVEGTSGSNRIFDLSGNVAEWEDSCVGSSGANDQCSRRGGSFDDTNAAGVMDIECGFSEMTNRRAGSGNDGSENDHTGIRCCGTAN